MLPLAFFIISLLYSIVGFGGGSSYLALLATSEVNYELMPQLSLICNLLVVSGGCWHYYKNHHFNKQLILPFVLSSTPLAFIGGMIPIRENTFLLLLSICLLFAGLRLLFVSEATEGEVRYPPMAMALMAGGVLGLLSGVVGLGGGIFLAPLMLNLKWGRPKEVAATASAFIFINSSAGLAGQLTKATSADFISYWPLFLAVVMGGQIGSRISNHTKISQNLIRRATALLILLICSRLIYKLVF
jgi:uncharacterized protein